MTDPEHAVLLDELLRYVREELVTGMPADALTADSQLLELGVLDSVRTARLLAHIRTTYGIRVPPAHMTGEHFRSVASITDLITLLRSQAASL